MKVIIDKHNFTTARESIQINATEDGHFKALIYYAVGGRLLKPSDQEGSYEVKQKEITADSKDAVRERTVAFLNGIFIPRQ